MKSIRLLILLLVVLTLAGTVHAATTALSGLAVTNNTQMFDDLILNSYIGNQTNYVTRRQNAGTLFTNMMNQLAIVRRAELAASNAILHAENVALEADAAGKATIEQLNVVSNWTALGFTNFIVLDPSRGSDSTGKRGDIRKPFATMATAQTNYVARDLMIVKRGNTSDGLTTNALIDYYLEEGAVIQPRFLGTNTIRISGMGIVTNCALENGPTIIANVENWVGITSVSTNTGQAGGPISIFLNSVYAEVDDRSLVTGQQFGNHSTNAFRWTIKASKEISLINWGRSGLSYFYCDAPLFTGGFDTFGPSEGSVFRGMEWTNSLGNAEIDPAIRDSVIYFDIKRVRGAATFLAGGIVVNNTTFDVAPSNAGQAEWGTNALYGTWRIAVTNAQGLVTNEFVQRLNPTSLHLDSATASTLASFSSSKGLGSSGISLTTAAFLDPTSSVQAQLNLKALQSSLVSTGQVLQSALTSTGQILHVEITNKLYSIQYTNDTGITMVLTPLGVFVFLGTNNFGGGGAGGTNALVYQAGVFDSTNTVIFRGKMFGGGITADPELSTYPSLFQLDHTLLHTEVGSAGFVMNDNVLDDSTTNRDNGALRGIARQNTLGNSHIRGGEFHVVRKVGDGQKFAWGIEVGVHSDIASSGTAVRDANTGIYIASSHTGWGNVGGVRADSGVWVTGEDGWTNGFRYTDTDGTTDLFTVERRGGVTGRLFGRFGNVTNLGGLTSISAGLPVGSSGLEISLDPVDTNAFYFRHYQAGVAFRNLKIQTEGGEVYIGPTNAIVVKLRTGGTSGMGVGIGTPSPSNALHVAGNMRVEQSTNNTTGNKLFFATSVPTSEKGVQFLMGSNTNIFTIQHIFAGNAYFDLALSPDGGAVGIGTGSANPLDATAILEVKSTTKGLLLPRMTKAQRDAISSPANGLMIYQTDSTPGLRLRSGGAWVRYTETADP